MMNYQSLVTGCDFVSERPLDIRKPLEQPEKSIVLKIILGGDANAGKTSLIQRYCRDSFAQQRKMTVGVDINTCDVEVDGAPLRLTIWDIGGQDRFAPMRQDFYRGAHAVGLLVDASNRVSLYGLARWRCELREHLPNVPILLLANKTDLPREISSAELRRIANAWELVVSEASCANGDGVADFVQALAKHALHYALQREQRSRLK